MHTAVKHSLGKEQEKLKKKKREDPLRIHKIQF